MYSRRKVVTPCHKHALAFERHARRRSPRKEDSASVARCALRVARCALRVFFARATLYRVPEYLFMLRLPVFLLTPSVHLLEHSSSGAVNLSERCPVRIHSRDRPIWSISVITLRLQNTGWKSEH